MRQCPTCRNEKAHFVGQICGDCVAQGKDLSPSEGAMPTGKMEKRPCAKGCGKMLDPRGAHKHEGTCPGGQGGGSARSLPARRGPQSAKRRAHSAGDGAALGAAQITVELQAMMDECQRAIELVGLAAQR